MHSVLFQHINYKIHCCCCCCRRTDNPFDSDNHSLLWSQSSHLSHKFLHSHSALTTQTAHNCGMTGTLLSIYSMMIAPKCRTMSLWPPPCKYVLPFPHPPPRIDPADLNSSPQRKFTIKNTIPKSQNLCLLKANWINSVICLTERRFLRKTAQQAQADLSF